MKGITDEIKNLLARNEVAALCLVVDTKGSTPLKIGAKMLVWENGKIFGTIGGGSLEYGVIKQAQSTILLGKPELFTHNLVRDHNMCCGGTVKVYIEPLLKQDELFIFGAGHVSKALTRHTEFLNFNVTVIDDRPDIFNDWAAVGKNFVNKPFSEALRELKFNPELFIAIMTYRHQTDREILSYCIKQPGCFLGMIGSKRKAYVTRKHFILNKLATKEEFDRVNTPIGINIQAYTPDEIAISIVAKLIAVRSRNQPGMVSISDSSIDKEGECVDLNKKNTKSLQRVC